MVVKKGAFVQNSWVCSAKKKFDPLLDGFKSSVSGVAKFNDTGGDDSLQPISRVYTSHFDNGMARLKPPVEVVLKKVPGTVHSGRPPKSEPDRIVPYHAVEKKPLHFQLDCLRIDSPASTPHF